MNNSYCTITNHNHTNSSRAQHCHRFVVDRVVRGLIRGSDNLLPGRVLLRMVLQKTGPKPVSIRDSCTSADGPVLVHYRITATILRPFRPAVLRESAHVRKREEPFRHLRGACTRNKTDG